MKIFLIFFTLLVSFNTLAEDNNDLVKWQKLSARIASYKHSLENDPRLNPIRGFVRLLSSDHIKANWELNRKATQTEKKALNVWIQLRDQYMNDGYVTTGSTAELNYLGSDIRSMFVKLRDGDITYAEMDIWQENMFKEQEKESKKILADLDAIKNTIDLTCTYTSPDQLAGTDILVSVDLKNNHIYVNRNDMKEPLITENQFQFKVSNDSVVKISRNTGQFIATYSDGVLARANCDKTKQAKF